MSKTFIFHNNNTEKLLTNLSKQWLFNEQDGYLFFFKILIFLNLSEFVQLFFTFMKIFFVTSRSTEILVVSNFWLGVYT